MAGRTRKVVVAVLRLALLLALVFSFCAAVSVFLFHEPFYHGFPALVGALCGSLLSRKWLGLERKP